MARKINVLEHTVEDPKHWIGWILLAFAIVGIFYIMPVYIMTNLYLRISVIFIIIVFIDIIKHYLKLQ